MAVLYCHDGLYLRVVLVEYCRLAVDFGGDAVFWWTWGGPEVLAWSLDEPSRVGESAIVREATSGLMYGALIVFSVPMPLIAGWLSDRLGRKPLILIGWGVYALVYAAFALLELLPGGWQIIATLVLFAVYALYYALCEGAEKALVADLVGADRRGTAFGLYNFAIGLGALPASLAFGIIYNALGGSVAFGMGALLAAISMVLLASVVREAPRPKFQIPIPEPRHQRRDRFPAHSSTTSRSSRIRASPADRLRSVSVRNSASTAGRSCAAATAGNFARTTQPS